MPSFKASPLSRNDIRRYARKIRKALNIDNELYVDVAALLENIVREIDPDFDFEVKTFEEMGNMHGLTLLEENKIFIREDIYDGANRGNGRDRMTIMHEFGHYLLHNELRLGLARVGDNEEVKPYRDPEWQAKAFAGEFLIPEHLTRNLKPEQIAEYCGVSYMAAVYQKSKM